MVFLAGLFLSIGMALAQTQVTGTVTAAEDGALSLVRLSR